MSTDSLGNLFDRLRGSVDDAEEPSELPEATEPAATEATERTEMVAEAPVAGEMPEVPEFEALVVEVVDEFATERVEPEPKWPIFGPA